MLPKDLDDNDDYSFEYSPDGAPLDQMTAASFKSDEDDFGDTLDEIHKHMKKGNVIKMYGSTIKVKKVDIKERLEVSFAVEGNKMTVKSTLYKKKKPHEYHLRILPISGGPSSHLLPIVRAYKCIIDGVLDKSISVAQIRRFFLTPLQAKSAEPCPTCGKTFKTLQGTKAHKCSVLDGTQHNFECALCNEYFDCESNLERHELSHNNGSDAIPPMKKVKEADLPADVAMKNLDEINPIPADTETIEVAAMQAALAADVLDHSQLHIKTDTYLKYHYPGRVVVTVDPDGACMPRAVGVCLFKDDEHWTLLSKSINKFIRENWPLIGGLLKFPMLLKLGGSGKEIVAQNEAEYLQYLKRDEALFIWRDYWDMRAPACEDYCCQGQG